MSEAIVSQLREAIREVLDRHSLTAIEVDRYTGDDEYAGRDIHLVSRDSEEVVVEDAASVFLRVAPKRRSHS